MQTTILSDLFHSITGVSPQSIKALSAAGSNRLYYRLTADQHSLIGVVGTSNDENKAFVVISRHFAASSLPVPRVLAHTPDYSCYLQEDKGDVLLFDYLTDSRKSEKYSADDLKLLYKAMQGLAEIQIKGDKYMDYTVCYPQPSFDERTIRWDLNYFKYDFLKITGLDFKEDQLENDFEMLIEDLQACKYWGFMYRDFQSRNIMVHNNELSYIDFQGGRRGPLAYDVASFVWQAKAAYPQEIKEQLVNVYLKTLKDNIELDEIQFRDELNRMVYFRLLQVLGAYGFRGLIEKKVAFAESIPFAIKSLTELTKSNKKYSYLNQLIADLSLMERFKFGVKRDKLLIKIYSFSYKKGIPEDYTSNGGGFVFDCRAIHNPGKYNEYKKLTGLDPSVKDFLEKDGEILHFIENVKSIVSPSVERYLKRGFTDLMISFGCTGGQHRSVYSAQNIAEYLHKHYNVDVELIHREQNIKAILESSQLQ